MIADESSTANLRWAGNTLTTNGVAASRSLTVISVDRRADGTAGVGMVARSGVTPGQVEDVVREAEKAAAEASAAEDAADLVTGAAGFRSGTSSWSASHRTLQAQQTCEHCAEFSWDLLTPVRQVHMPGCVPSAHEKGLDGEDLL